MKSELNKVPKNVPDIIKERVNAANKKIDERRKLAATFAKRKKK